MTRALEQQFAYKIKVPVSSSTAIDVWPREANTSVRFRGRQLEDSAGHFFFSPGLFTYYSGKDDGLTTWYLVRRVYK